VSEFAGQTFTAHIPYGSGVEAPPLDDEAKSMLIDAALGDASHAHGCGWESWRVTDEALATPAMAPGCTKDDCDIDPEVRLDHDHTEGCWTFVYDGTGRQIFNWALMVKAVAS
jgi:hypothetical protein